MDQLDSLLLSAYGEALDQERQTTDTSLTFGTKRDIIYNWWLQDFSTLASGAAWLFNSW
jgi:hypothetical protein